MTEIKQTIWIDIENSAEPAFFHPFIKFFKSTRRSVYVTARDYAEVVPLLEKRNIEYRIIGKYYGSNKISKAVGHMARTFKLYLSVPKYDIALLHDSLSSMLVSKIKGKCSIAFSDNDLPYSMLTKFFMRYATHVVLPASIPTINYTRFKVKSERIIQFDGFKEDISIADFIPDKEFRKTIPFGDFVTVRPEALKANYVPGATSIVPELLKKLKENGLNVLFLPRYPEDRSYAEGFDNIYIPPSPLNGLDVCWNSRAVLTGSGTFAREAACMGVPAISFFPGTDLLSVDKEMIRRGWLFHSREINSIIAHLNSARRRRPDIERSKAVQKECLKIVDELTDI